VVIGRIGRFSKPRRQLTARGVPPDLRRAPAESGGRTRRATVNDSRRGVYCRDRVNGWREGRPACRSCRRVALEPISARPGRLPGV